MSAEADLTADEQAAFDRVMSTFGEGNVAVGKFEPAEDARPDVVLPEIEPIPLPPQMVNGLDFATAAFGEEAAIWGSGDGVAWAPGEAALIVGPDGVGKTTLVQRLIMGLVGITPELLASISRPRTVTCCTSRPTGRSRQPA